MSSQNHLTKEEIQEKQKSLDLKQIVEGYGIQVFPFGSGRYRCVCPFHSDSDPSLVMFMNNSPHTWYCYGCERGTDIFQFILLKEGISFYEILKRYFEPDKLHPNITYQHIVLTEPKIGNLNEEIESRNQQISLIIKSKFSSQEIPLEEQLKWYKWLDNFFDMPNLSITDVEFMINEILNKLNKI